MSRNAIDGDRSEALRLKDELYKQAQFYRKHAPACATDIALFEDAAALLDSYQAGLALVTPHPLCASELVQWVGGHMAHPGWGETVLAFNAEKRAEGVWLVIYVKDEWRSVEHGLPVSVPLTHWAKLPQGLMPLPTVADRTEELAA